MKIQCPNCGFDFQVIQEGGYTICPKCATELEVTLYSEVPLIAEVGIAD